MSALRGRVIAYGRYQLTDFLLLRASLPLVILSLFAGIQIWFITRGMTAELAQRPMYVKQMQFIYSHEVTIFLPLCAFLGAVMVASADRALGHFRFFFSKPVSVRRFYAQAYLVHGLTFVVLFGLITILFNARTMTHQPVFAGMAAAALSFLMFGGLGLLFGNFAQLDAILVPAVYVLSLALQLTLVSTPGAFGPAVHAFAKTLPPVVYLDSVQTHLYNSTSMDPSQLWFVILYGGAAALIGILIIRRSPLSQ
jgi:hypothetical protein